MQVFVTADRVLSQGGPILKPGSFVSAEPFELVPGEMAWLMLCRGSGQASLPDGFKKYYKITNISGRKLKVSAFISLRHILLCPYTKVK